MGGPASGPYSKSWPDARLEQLKLLVADNLAASAIAKILGEGLTRSAIIGKCHRIGLQLTGGPGGGPTHKGPAKRRRHVPQRILGFHAAGNKLRSAPVAIVPDTEIPKGQRVGVLDLRFDTCRWPVGDPQSPDFFFCGALPYPGKPYCEGHCRQAYVKLRLLSRAEVEENRRKEFARVKAMNRPSPAINVPLSWRHIKEAYSGAA